MARKKITRAFRDAHMRHVLHSAFLDEVLWAREKRFKCRDRDAALYFAECARVLNRELKNLRR